MRISVFLLFVSFFHLYAIDSYSQEKRLSVSGTDMSLRQLFNNIEKQSEFLFFYVDADIENIMVNVNVRDASVTTLLDQALSKTNLVYEINDRHITIAPGYKAKFVQPGINLSGTVIDETGETMPGVNVMLKGTTSGVVTNADGQFNITVSGPDAVLAFSFIGYVTQEITVGAQRRFDITMKEDLKELEEVVVVGYGIQKKVNLTGSVAMITGDELTKRPVTNPTLLLQGKVAGVQIVQNSGQPGLDNSSIQIRGMGTFSDAGSNPLVLIDGVEGSLSTLNPNMIENISVLKDAASASIYGVRAANGVILITTKQGAANRFNIEYQYNLGIQTPTRLPDLIYNSVEFMELMNEAIDRTGQQTAKRYSDADIQAYRDGASDPLRYPNYDWIDAMFDNALMHQHYLSVNGGGDKTTYNFGLGILNQDGVLMATSYDKYDAMLNINTTMNKYVSFGGNVNFTYSDRKQQNGTMENTILCIYTAHPTYGPQLPDGSGRYVSRAYPYESSNQNPIAFSRLGGTTVNNYNASGMAYLKLNILDGLTGEVRGAGRWSMANSLAQSASIPVYYYQPYADGTYGAAQNFGGNDHSITRNDENSTKYTLYATLTYDKTFAQKHHLTLLGGYNQENFKFWTLSGYRYQYINLDMTDLDAGNSNGQTTGGKTEEWAIQSLFGRVNYAFKDKYLFEASVRYDGSSRLKKENRWGVFPSVSAGWRISEENFAKSVSWMDNLKIRGSWGKLGNDNIGNYPWQDLLGLTYYSFNSYSQGVEKTKMSNQDITWEKTTSVDIGMDFSFFKNRIYGTVDWFDRKTTSILRKKQVPYYTGMDGPTVNEGEMKNTGFEFLLGHENTIGDFTYGISANLTTYKNEVTRYGAREISGQRLRQEGLPWNSYYLLENVGIFRSQAELDDPNTPKHQANPLPGDLRYRDVSGPNGVPDNEIDPTYDRVVVDGAFPKFNYGINLFAAYKGFDLSVFFQGVHGRKVYVREWGIAPFRQYGPPPVMWRDRWTPDNPDASLPGLWVENSYTPNTQASTFWLQDASYLRLKNLQIGYNFPSQWISKLRLQQLRVYFSGDNLFTITDFFEGGDPERIDEGRFAIYPQTAIYSFGVKLTF